MVISREEAARIIISAHDCLFSPFSDREGVVETVRRLGYVQFDTIHVFMRAQDHTLWNRVEGYRKEWLDEEQKDSRRLYEYWSHAAAVIPMEYFRFCLPRMERIRNQGRFWFEHIPDVSDTVLEAIKNEGPKKARDFKDDNHRGNRWDWKPAKRALQYLQMAGIISVSHRESFQKVYDLTERIIPSDIDTSMPSPEEMAEHLIISRLGAEGLLTEQDITYLRKDGVSSVPARLHELVEEGIVVRVLVDGTDFFGLRKSVEEALSENSESAKVHGESADPEVRILSPFDNLVILRKRLETVFKFPLYLECYLPAVKRKFGYFTQPVLFGDEFVGKIDFKISGRQAVVHNFECERRKGFTRSFRREWKRILAARGAEETRMEDLPEKYKNLF